MQKYFDSIVGPNGVPLSGSSITVYNYGTTTLSSLFSDANGATPIGNPLTADATGYFEFYAADGRYTLSIAATGYATKTVTDILLDDPANFQAGVTTPVAYGGTGATTLTGLLRGNGTSAVTGGALVALGSEVSGLLPVASGGTGASDAATARSNLGLGSAATQNTGTSGAAVPLLNGINTWGANQTFGASVNYSGTAARIQGDFTNATITNRALFQSNVTDGQTLIGAVPNGTSNTSGSRYYSAADPTNASFVGYTMVGGTEARIESSRNGSGTFLPLTFYVNGAEGMRLATNNQLTLAGNLRVNGFIMDGAGNAAFNPASAGSLAITSTGTYTNGNIVYNALAASGTHIWQSNSTERMRLDASGRLGVGVTPTFALDVFSSGNGIIRVRGGTGTNEGGAFFVRNAADTSTLAAFGDRARIFGGTPDQSVSIFTSGAPLLFDVNGTTKATIDTSGNLLLGRTAQIGSERLSVSGTAASNNYAFEPSNSGTATATSSIAFDPVYLGASGRTVVAQIDFVRPSTTDGNYDGYIAFQTRANGSAMAERMRLDASGNLGVGVTPTAGINASIQTKDGIRFPATQVPSTDPNTLDDYEEGAWTPNQGAGLTVVGAFNSSGQYTKIGRQVTAVGIIQPATSVAVSAGGIISTNLPFTNSAWRAHGSMCNADGSVGGATVVTQNTTTLYACVTVAANGNITFTITYFV